MSDTEPIDIPELATPPEKAQNTTSAPKPAAARKPANPAKGSDKAGKRKTPARHDTTWNLLTALILAATFFLASIYVLIYTRPELLAQNTPLGFLIANTPTLPALALPPVSSPTPTLEPTQPATPEPATPETPLPTLTATPQAIEATPVDPNATPQGTPDAISFYPFNVQGEINAIDGTVIDQNHDCEWMGIAGRIQDADGSPITGMQVHLVGYLDGRNRDLLTLSGTGQAFGPGGFEFTLANRPIRSSDSLWIQLVEQNGLPLSPRIRFNTYAECNKNLIVINFIKVK